MSSPLGVRPFSVAVFVLVAFLPSRGVALDPTSLSAADRMAAVPPKPDAPNELEIASPVVPDAPSAPAADPPEQPLNCPPGGQFEPDPPTGPCPTTLGGLDDIYNGGCNANPSAFGFFPCDSTVCGTSGQANGFYDLDWYDIFVNVPSEVTLTVTADFRSYTAIINDQCGTGLAIIAASLDNPIGQPASVTACLNPGPYRLLIRPQGNFGGAQPDQTPCPADYVAALTCLHSGSGPQNDSCFNALPISAGTTVSSNSCASTDQSANCAPSNGDVWHSFTANCNGDVTIETCGSNAASGIDTVVSVYDACFGFELACNDDANPPPAGCAATDSSLTFPAAAGLTYFVRVASYGSAGQQGEFHLTITESSVTPQITDQPDSTSVCAGSLATFSVAASGATGYQWQVSTNGGASFSNIVGAVNPTYSFVASLANNNWQYRCLVSSGCAAVLSSPAVLTVTGVPPAPTGVAAADGTSCAAVTVSWNASAGATGYQIWRNTVNNSGTATQIATDNASPYLDTTGVAGTTYFYWVKATNGCGPSPFSLSDSGFRNAAPTAPTNVAATDGSSCSGVTITWSASAGATSYGIWRHTVNVSGSAVQIATDNASPFDDTTAVPGTTYFYWVTAANGCGGSPFSSSDSGSTAAGVTITQQPQDQTVWGDAPAQFDVGAAGASGFQWQRSTDGGGSFQDIAGANSDAYSFFPSAVDNLNQFRCEVEGVPGCPPVQSEPATLTVNVGPSITAHPLSQTLWPGEPAMFSLQSTGTPPLTYQWQHEPAGGGGFVDIPGADGPTFNFPNVSLPNNGDKLRCNVSNACGVATSDAATIVVAGFFESPPTMSMVHPTVTMDMASARVASNVGMTVCLDPVNLFSGEFYEAVTDLRIPGRGLDFVWARHYRSRYGQNSDIGNGWDFSYNIRIEMFDVHVRVHDGHGRQDIYLLQPDGTYSRRELFNRGAFNPDGTFTLTFPDMGIWNFRELNGSQAQGKIASIVDRNGNTLTFQYGSQGRLTTVTDTLDRDIDVFYNPNGRIARIRDHSGREVVYSYYNDGDAGGAAGDLKSVRSPIVNGTPNQNNFPNGKTTVYTYTTGFADPQLNHDLLTITDPKGQTYLQNTYAHTVAPSDPRYTLDPANVNYDRIVRQVWGDAGDIIDIVYNPQAPTPDNCFAVFKATVNDRVGNVEEHLFNACNQLVQLREHTGRADPDSLTDLDAMPPINPPVNPLRPDDPAVFTTCYEYNADSLLVRVIHPNLNEDLYGYDELNPDRRAHGNMLTHCRKAGPLGGEPAVQLCENWSYQPTFNHIASHTDYRGNSESHSYDAVGNRIHTQHRIPAIVEDWEYNAFGQMTRHTLPDNGSGWRREDAYTYHTGGDQAGYLEDEVVDADNLQLTTSYEYDEVGNIVRVIDPRGHDTLDDVNQLNQVVRERSRLVNGVRYEKLTWYDANNNVVRVDVQNRNEEGILQANTHFSTVYEYETLNFTTRICQERGEAHLAFTQLDCQSLPVGVFITTEYVHDANRNRTLMRYGAAVSGAQPNNTILGLYDERDLDFRFTRASGQLNQSTVQFDYDGNSNRRAVRVGLEGTPRVTLEVHDGYDRRRLTTDPMGNVTARHYDVNGNLVGEVVHGELIDIAGAAGNGLLASTAYEYDEMNRLIHIEREFFDTETLTPIDDGVAATDLVYAHDSQVIEFIDDNNHSTTTGYDTANRASVSTDAKGNTTQYGYDANSNITSIVDTDKHDLPGNPDQVFTTTFVYDGVDRIISVSNNVGSVRQYAYDSRDNLARADDPLGRQNRYAHDGLNRLVQIVRDMDGDGANAADPADIVTAQTWDDTSRLTVLTDDNGHATLYTYDCLNRRVATTYADGTTTTMTFDVHDNIVGASDANGTDVVNTYDLLDRLVARSVSPGPTVSDQTTTENYQYDGLSRIVSGVDDDATIERRYDSLSRMTLETVNGRATARLFDGVGNELEVAYPGGRLVTSVYDALDRKSTVSDASGLIAAYSYVGHDREARRDYGNGTRATWTYDGITGVPNPAGDFGVRQVIRVTHERIAAGAVIDDRTFAWDRVGNKTRRKDVRAGGPQHTHDYSYDAADRLIHAAVTDPASLVLRDTNYALDGVHNWTAVTGNPDAGSYVGPYSCLGGLPEPADCQVNQYSSTPTHTLDYDANGNLRRRCGPVTPGAPDLCDLGKFAQCLTGPGVDATIGCGTFDYDLDGDVDLRDISQFQNLFTTAAAGSAAMSYDYRNQMVEYLDLGTGQRHVYSYDAFGRRIAKTINADDIAGLPLEETHFIYDGWREIEELEVSGATRATYVYGNYIDEILNMQRDVAGPPAPEDFYYHADDLHSVMAISDSAGNVVERYDYGDYGQPEFRSPGDAPMPHSNIANAWLFTGRRYDAETGLYYFRLRYLDPTTGRFTTRDPIGVWTDPRNLGNGYAYVGGNPWSRLDPYGLQDAHDSNKEPSKLEKHEEGQSRAQRDQQRSENLPDKKLAEQKAAERELRQAEERLKEIEKKLEELQDKKKAPPKSPAELEKAKKELMDEADDLAKKLKKAGRPLPNLRWLGRALGRLSVVVGAVDLGLLLAEAIAGPKPEEYSWWDVMKFGLKEWKDWICGGSQPAPGPAPAPPPKEPPPEPPNDPPPPDPRSDPRGIN